MKRINTLVATTLLGATLGLGAAPAGAVDGLLLKVELFPGYCHLQVPAIDENSLGHRPVLQDASTTDIIDFYGPAIMIHWDVTKCKTRDPRTDHTTRPVTMMTKSHQGAAEQ